MSVKIFLGLLLSSSIFAAPVGNTSFPDLIERGFFSCGNQGLNFRFGYEGDFVSDGKMQHARRVDDYQQWTNSASITLNFLERMDLYSVLGSSKTKAKWRFEAGEIIHRIQLETASNFLWALGGRAILYEWCNTSLGFGGRFSSCNYQPTFLNQDGVDYEVSGPKCEWEEWQINMDISYKIHLFTPYIGVKYDHARTNFSHFVIPLGRDTLENRTPFGLYLGCALSNQNYFMFNIEARLVNEEAVTVSSDFRF